MLISIITVTYNSAATLSGTLESVKHQDYPQIEHILVDGGSTDKTVEIIQSYPHIKKWVSEKDNGLYDAINKGILMASGDVVGLLHSDDFFPDNNVISKIVKKFMETNVDAVYGDIAFVKPGRLDKVVRLYSSRKFTTKKFAYGYMPAHPSFYVRRQVYEQFGLYKMDYTIASDYEMLMRLMYRNHITFTYLPEVVVYMRTGGLSNKSILSRYTLNREIIKACRENGVKTNMVILSFKYLKKIFEFIKPVVSPIGKQKT